MAYNKVENINRAKKNRDDEFYTPYSVVEGELSNYSDYLRGKRIICPCESPEELIDILTFKSVLRIRNRGLLGTYGNIYTVDLTNIPYDKLKVTDTLTGNFIKYLLLNFESIKFESLSFSGITDTESTDFRSINYSNYDVAITNPPFTLMDDFINVVVNRFGKDVIVLSSQLAVTLKSIRPHIFTGKIHYGYLRRLDCLYYARCGRIVYSNEPEGNTAACCSFMTTVEIPQPQPLKLENKDLSTYRYFNDYLFVEKSKDIPANYDGVMIVPITFLMKWNREQFTLVDMIQGMDDENGNRLFQKVLIRRL